MDSEIKIYGIRHHGAGSARRVYESMQKFKPDVVCIEMPYEANRILNSLSKSTHSCPLAIMYYNPNNPSQSLYYPFADFSPEYQAMRYAFENEIPIHAIDLPAGISLVSSNFKNNNEESLNRNQRQMIHDPIGYLARRSGYEDTELWWSTYFETWTEGDDLFETVLGLMKELRIHSKGLDDDETLAREEFMRTEIRKIQITKPQRMAIVCGAWHGPVLLEEGKYANKKIDLNSLNSIPIHQSIIPWTYSRLIMNTDYSAGIESPLWSECIYNNPSQAAAQWLSVAAGILRKKGIMISTSELIDCDRLARELAMIRELPLPGLNELTESCITVLGRSEDERISVIRNEVFAGSKTGSIDLKKDELSLVIEFKNFLKDLRLTPFWSEEAKENLALDLRKEKHLNVSRFLHKTILLGLNWCEDVATEIQSLGTFHEDWVFSWNDDYEIELAHKAIQGTTIEEVIIINIETAIDRSDNLGILAELMEHALKANMSSPWLKILEKIKLKSFENSDITELSSLLHPLISCISYGSLYELDKNQLISIIDFILPKIVLEYGQQSSFINNEKAYKLIETFLLIDKYFIHVPDSEFLELWNRESQKNSVQETVHPLVRGFIWNKLLDSDLKQEQEFYTELEYQFAGQIKIENTASWIEGFLYQSTSFYQVQEKVLETMDHWLKNLNEEEFKSVLPLLRRSFSNLGNAEINSIKKYVFRKTNQENDAKSILAVLDEERVKIASKLISQLLS